jgi:hypothetical protein
MNRRGPRSSAAPPRNRHPAAPSRALGSAAPLRSQAPGVPARGLAPGVPERSAGAPRFLLFAVVLIGVPLAFVGTSTLLLLAVGMLPTIVAVMIDRSRDKLAAVTVGPLNFAALLVPLTQLWLGANDMTQALAILSRPSTGVIVYGAAGAGWLLYFLVPPVVAKALVSSRQQRIAKLTAEQKALADLWGEDVKGRVAMPSPPA